MDFLNMLNPVARWLHILAGVMWIGLLYFFNFINGHVAATMDGDTKKKVVPELMPRALFWFRWGAAWTWFSGMILLYIIFWNGSLGMGESVGTVMVDAGSEVTMWTHIMLLVTFVAVFAYDFLYKSALAKNVRLITVISFLLIAVVEYAMICFGNYSYRAFNIHIGAMFGTMMAFNVWFRIWPAQQKIITAIKNGDAPDGNLVALATTRSKHNTYMSIPLLWTMINQHTVVFSGKLFDITGLVLLVVIVLGWHIAFQLYKKSGKVKGF
ncbi:MAG: hypothetical protein CMG01_05865 [Candidatus Marinimicrobia bacterium]|nr:hypothetical protein [Candidatus Neomarinimicrobiota bacterium]